MRRIGPAAVLLLALVACGGDGDPTPSPSPSTSSAPPTTTPTTPPPASPTGPVCTLPTPAPAGATVIEASVTGGKVTTDKQRYDVKLGSPVRLIVTTDVADEVHVHTYDLRAKTMPGCPEVVDFQARVPGSVEVELESSHLELFEVRAR